MLLSRFWKPLAVMALLSVAGLYLHHHWFAAGAASRDAYWRPLFDEAARERDAANAEAARKTADSIHLSQSAEAHHAEIEASLTLRAADAEHRYADLLRKRSASASRCEMSPDGGPAGPPDAARASEQRDERAAKDFAKLARNCEADAATLTDLQEWVRGQQQIMRSH